MRVRLALLAAVTIAVGTAAQAQSQAPEPRIGQVATRGQYPGYGPANLGPIRQIMSRIEHRARDTMTGSRLIYVNYWGNAETPTGADLMVSVSIEYPLGTFSRIRCQGQITCLVPDGGQVITDPAPVTIPDGALFREWVWAASPKGIPTFPTSRSVDRGAWSTSATPSIDVSESGGDLVPRDWAYGATALIGPTSRPSVFIMGDSRAESTYGMPGSNDGGNLAPGIGARFAYINVAVGGETVYQQLTRSAKRRSLAQYTTRVAIASGINDLHSVVTPVASTIRQLNHLAGLFRGRPVYISTIEPRSTGNWGAADGSDQSVDITLSEKIDKYNSAIRAGNLSNVAGFNDLNAIARNKSDPFKWNAPDYTSDGLHGSGKFSLESMNGLNSRLMSP